MTTIEEAVEAEASPAEEAIAAVHVGLYVSAFRCVLTYVVAPALGAVGVLLGPVGLLLQVLGTITAGYGARRLWVLRHRVRIPYAALAAVVTALTLVTISQAIAEVLR